MDPMQVLQSVPSLPANSPEQIALLAQLKDQFEQQPGTIPAFVPALLGGLLSVPDSAFKRWVLEVLHLSLFRFNIPPDVKAQLALQCLDSLAFLLGDSSVQIVKLSIECLSSGWPHLFRLFCSNRSTRTPVDTWNAAKRRLVGFLESPRTPPGIIVVTLKFVQRVILVQSRAFSDPRLQNKSDSHLGMCPPDHPLMRAQDLETEGIQLLQQMINMMYQNQNPDVLSAIFNCLVLIVKQRSSLLSHILPALMAWTPAHIASTLSASEVKSAEKAFRIAMIHILRHGLAGQFQKEINDALGVQQVRMEQAAREEQARRAEVNRKRLLNEPGVDPSLAKRPKTEPEAGPSSDNLNVLANFDFTTLPQSLVIDLVIANLIAVSKPQLDAAVQTYRQSNPSAAVPDVPVPSTAPLPPVKDEPFDPLKMELDEDEIDFEPEKLNNDLEVEGHDQDQEGDDEQLLTVLQQVQFELPPPRQLNDSERNEMIRSTISRIQKAGEESSPVAPTAVGDSEVVEAETPLPVTGLPGSEAWILFLIRMATRGPGAEGPHVQEESEESVALIKAGGPGPATLRSNAIRAFLCDYVLEDFATRSRIATIWMNEEWYNDTIRSELSVWQPQYDVWVQKLLISQKNKMDAKDKAFSRFLLDLPTLPPNLLNLLSDMCLDSEIMPIGFTSLRELVALRPPVRTEAMKILLDLTTHSDKTIRGAAIITVRRWVPDQQPMDGMVRIFAKGMLQRLATIEKKEPTPPPPVTEGSDGMLVDTVDGLHVTSPVSDVRDEKTVSSYLEPELAMPPERGVVLQHIELLLGLAVKVPDFLEELFEAYGRMEAPVQDIVRTLLTPLVKTLGPSNPKLLEQLRSFKPEAETLALQILTILTDNARPPAAIVSLIKDLLSERDLNPKFLILIIAEMDKADIDKHLPRIVSTLSGKPEDREQVRKVFGNIVTEAPAGASSNMPRVRQSERLAPAELMVLLHNQEKEIGLKAAIEAIGICFAMSDVFRSETLGAVMQQIVDQQVLPVLFMRTVIQAVTTYKNLVSFVTTTLFSRLIVKKIWTNGALWEGFIRCAKITAPASFGALLQLQKEQLREVVDKQPSLKSGLREYVIKKERSKSKLASFLETLGDSEPNGADPPAAPSPKPMPTALSPNA